MRLMNYSRILYFLLNLSDDIIYIYKHLYQSSKFGKSNDFDIMDIVELTLCLHWLEAFALNRAALWTMSASLVLYELTWYTWLCSSAESEPFFLMRSVPTFSLWNLCLSCSSHLLSEESQLYLQLQLEGHNIQYIQIIKYFTFFMLKF